jgi:sugar/nucleoside kinase (ribokinase family)
MPNPADLVVVVGAFTIDDVVLPDGTTHMATLGGNCVYSATAVVAGGASAAVVARRGQDFPVEALAALADAGIDVSKIVDIPGPTQRNWIIYESDGRRSWVYRTTPDRFEAATPQLSDLDAGQLDHARVVHVTALALASSEAIVAHIRRRAPAAIITLDTHEDWVAALSPRVLRLAHQVDVFVPSLEELLALTGATEPVDALQDLAAAGLGRVVLKAGARGAYVLDGDVITHVAALETTVADTTGAGDTFCGGLAAGLARGLGLVEAVALGSAVAGTAITGVGSLRLFEVGRNRDAIQAAGRGLAAAATFVGTARRNQRSARPEPRAASDPPGAGSLAALPDLVSDVLDDVDGRLRALAQRFTDAGTRHLWLSGSGLSTVAASAVSLAFLEHTYVTPHPIRATDLAAYYSPYLPVTDAVLSLSADVAGGRHETRLFDPADARATPRRAGPWHFGTGLRTRPAAVTGRRNASGRGRRRKRRGRAASVGFTARDAGRRSPRGDRAIRRGDSSLGAFCARRCRASGRVGVRGGWRRPAGRDGESHRGRARSRHHGSCRACCTRGASRAGQRSAGPGSRRWVGPTAHTGCAGGAVPGHRGRRPGRSGRPARRTTVVTPA